MYILKLLITAYAVHCTAENAVFVCVIMCEFKCVCVCFHNGNVCVCFCVPRRILRGHCHVINYIASKDFSPQQMLFVSHVFLLYVCLRVSVCMCDLSNRSKRIKPSSQTNEPTMTSIYFNEQKRNYIISYFF